MAIDGCLLQADHPPLVCWLDHLFFQETKTHMLKVRLDIFHALQRISRLVKKSHGAHRTFMSRLRDACFIVNKDDIREVSVVGVICVIRRGRNIEAVIISRRNLLQGTPYVVANNAFRFVLQHGACV